LLKSEIQRLLIIHGIVVAIAEDFIQIPRNEEPFIGGKRFMIEKQIVVMPTCINIAVLKIPLPKGEGIYMQRS